jgi:hypothetical protein
MSKECGQDVQEGEIRGNLSDLESRLAHLLERVNDLEDVLSCVLTERNGQDEAKEESKFKTELGERIEFCKKRTGVIHGLIDNIISRVEL